MKCVNALEVEEVTAEPTNRLSREIRFPVGILGFEEIRRYELVTNPGEEPFEWMRAKENASLAFVVLNPFLVLPEYQPDIPDTDVDSLEIEKPEDVLLFNIVTVRGGGATINLKGPIVVNRNTWVGKQVILANASDYSVRHVLPAAEAAA